VGCCNPALPPGDHRPGRLREPAGEVLYLVFPKRQESHQSPGSLAPLLSRSALYVVSLDQPKCLLPLALSDVVWQFCASGAPCRQVLAVSSGAFCRVSSLWLRRFTLCTPDVVAFHTDSAIICNLLLSLLNWGNCAVHPTKRLIYTYRHLKADFYIHI